MTTRRQAFSDSIFMMPHLGVLSTINEKRSDVFIDCMVYLRDLCRRSGRERGDRCADHTITFPDGRVDKDNSRSAAFGWFRSPMDRSAIRSQPAKQVNLRAGASAGHAKVHGEWWGYCSMGAGAHCGACRPQCQVASLTNGTAQSGCTRLQIMLNEE
jgi:hypothetical protein